MKTHEPTMTGTKTCSKCNRELPVICFSVHRQSNDGLYAQCRECARQADKKRRPKKGLSKKKINLMKLTHELCDE